MANPELAEQGRQRVFVEPYGAAQTGALADVTNDVIMGGLWLRSDLSMRDRRLLTMAVLARYGKDELMRVHVRGALYHGELTPRELEEVAIHLAFYAGWPVGSSFNKVVGEVVSEWTGEGRPIVK